MKFYNSYCQEITGYGDSPADRYVRCVNKALSIEDDRDCAATFLAAMMDHKSTFEMMNLLDLTCLATYKGEELRKYIAGFEFEKKGEVIVQGKEKTRLKFEF